MRLAALTIAALLANSALAEEVAAVDEPSRAHAEAVVTVNFASGSFKPKPPELNVIDSRTGKAVASVRPREWTKKWATYAVSLPVGRGYGLRYEVPGEIGSFAHVSLAADAEGTVMYRVPYAPRRTVAAR